MFCWQAVTTPKCALNATTPQSAPNATHCLDNSEEVLAQVFLAQVALQADMLMGPSST